MKHKLETFVNFPIHDFDLTNYIANKNNSRRQLYELYALTNHYGSMGSGHYTAHIKVKCENFNPSNLLLNSSSVAKHLECSSVLRHDSYFPNVQLVDENRWYNFDDSHISPITEDEVNTAAAYVLFYRRVKTSDDAPVSNGA